MEDHRIALCLLALTLFICLPSVRAEVADPNAAVIEAALKLASALTSADFIGKAFTWLTTISGVCAFTIKPLWDRFVYPWLISYVQSTVTTKDDEILARILSNKAVKVALYLLNLIAHIKVPIVNAAGDAVSPTRAGLPPPPQP